MVLLHFFSDNSQMLSGSERGYDPAQVCALLSNAFVINNNFLVVRFYDTRSKWQFPSIFNGI